MFSTKLKLTAAAIAAAVSLGLILGLTSSRPAQARNQLADPVAKRADPKEGTGTERVDVWRYVESRTWIVTVVDAKERALSAVRLKMWDVEDLFEKEIAEAKANGGPVRMTYSRSGLAAYPVAHDAKITVNGREATLKDLTVGSRMTVLLDRKTSAIWEVAATTPERPVVKSIAPKTKKMIVTFPDGKAMTLQLTDRTRIYFGLATELKEYAGSEERKFGDLKPGMFVDFQLGVESGVVTVKALRAYSQFKW